MNALGLEYAAAVEANEHLKSALQKIVIEHYYEGHDPAWLESSNGRASVHYEAVDRYLNACRWVVPWVDAHCDLRKRTVIDIGAGTGATSAAFARIAESVVGYEIAKKSVSCAQARFSELGIKNAIVNHVPASEILNTVRYDYPDGGDIIVLFAVLEHLTQDERQDCLKTVWDLLRPGGHLVVVDTPNRFCLTDFHTSFLPFFHLLPEEVALRYIDRSPRKEFVSGMAHGFANGNPDETLYRWGIGASYHDFEIAFGCDLGPLIVANGYEYEMVNWFPPNLEEKLLVNYFIEKNIPADIGFARSVLNFIFRKPTNSLQDEPERSLSSQWIDQVISTFNLDVRLKERLLFRVQLDSTSLLSCDPTGA